MKTTVRSSLLYNQRGNVMLQILAATAAMGISFYFLTNYVIGQKRQMSKTVNAVSLRFALNSTMDYVIFGVRQKYCFTDDGILANAPAKDCTLASTGSVERLIMSTDQQNFIKMMHNPPAGGTPVDFGPGVDYNNLTLPSIHRYLNVKGLTGNHPLLTTMQKLQNVKDEITGQILEVTKVKVDIYRDDNPRLPRAGREVYMRIVLSLLDSSNNVISLGTSPLTLSSSVAVYPREVGSFALLMANDLRMDKSYDAAPSQGDVVFNQFANRKSVNGPGLVFLSPVFVNRDIYLPELPTDLKATADQTKYAAVTFADRVVMGNGWIKSGNGQQFEPRTAGAVSDRMWSDAVNFGGFLKGIENDGGFDNGLRVFAGLTNVKPPDSDTMSKCTIYNNSKGNVANYSNVSLGANLTSSTSTNYKMATVHRMYFSSMNSFNAQSIPAGVVNNSQWGKGSSIYDMSWYTNVVFDMKVTFGNKSIQVRMPFESVVTLKPEVGSPEAKQNLQAAIDAATATINSIQSDIDSQNAILAKYKKDLTSAKNDLKAEQAKPPLPKTGPAPASVDPTPTPTPTGTPAEGAPVAEASPTPTPSPSPSPTPVVDKTLYQDPDVIASLQAMITDLNAKISSFSTASLDSALSDANNSKTAAQNALSSYNTAVSSQPTIEIYLDRIKSNKADLYVTVKNISHMVDNTGQLGGLNISLKAYDYTYLNGAPVNSSIGDNPKLSGSLNYLFNSAKTQLVAPTSLTADPVADDNTDWDALAATCEAARASATSQSFGGASWDIDFSAGTRHSWNFAAGHEQTTAGQDPAVKKDYLFNSGNSPAPYVAPNWPEFLVMSIVQSCTIDSTATIVTGFYTCDSMTILARDKPLRIIGSFIVGKLKIDPKAYAAGITWSSIYHPQATRELRSIGILHPSGPLSCDMTSTSSPVWHPIPSIQELANRNTCNAISLREKADPFRWTSVDPDCGLPPSGTQSNTTCKRRLIRFYVVEQSREEGLKPEDIEKEFKL